jgi:hypothetical protein
VTAATTHDFRYGLLIGAAAAAVPAAWRATGVLSWLALWGATALIVGPVAGALRSLRPVPQALRVLGTGLALAAPALMLFGEVLQRTTHHRPLGAVTFALGGLGLVAGAVAVASRLHELRASASRLARYAAIGLTDAGVLVAAVLVALAARHPALRSGLLDAALACGAVALGARLPRLPLGDRAVAILGPTLWALVVVAGVVVLRLVPDVQCAGPVLIGFAVWLGPAI